MTDLARRFFGRLRPPDWRLLLAAMLLAHSAWAARELTVTFFDCGQGDAALLETPGGKTVLIDAGPVENDGFNAGKDVVFPYLKDNGIKRIDFAVMSHPHLDHIGGFQYILENMPVGMVLDPGYSYPSPDYKKILTTIQEKKIKYAVVRAGTPVEWDPALKVRAVSPPPVLPWDNPNDNSLVLQVQHGKVTFLFTGDMESEAEYEMVIRQGPSLQSQILKSAHHGSSTSSTPELLNYVKPETVVISCGRFNRFRHPSKKILRRYQEYELKIYRTDEQGHIQVISNGKKYTVKTRGVQ
jgi:competence protein ComEC